MVGQGKSKPMLTSQPLEGTTDKSDGTGNKTGRTSTDNTQQRAKAEHSIRKSGHERMSNSNHRRSWRSRSRIDGS